jgi:Cu/Ag efflux pump CusA
MLNRIVELSLRYRGVVIALACVVLVYGAHTTTRARLDVFPEFAPPQVVIQTEAPGMSPEEVETLVTRPVEAGLNGTPKLTALRSQSIQGLSAITVVFQDDADIFQCRQMITERLNEIIGRLPDGVEPPRMGPLTSTTSLTLAFGLTSTNRSPMELRTFAEWTLRPRLLGVKGVAKVELFGGERRQIQIRVNPDRLRVFSLGLTDVAAAVREAASLRGGGFVETANQRILFRAAGLPMTAAEIGEVMVSHHGSTGIRLSEVARVMDGAEPKFGDAQIMGAPGVILLVSSQYGANTLEVTQALEQLLAEIQPLFASERVTLHTPLFRPANFILDSLHNINRSMLMGSVLVGVCCSCFCGNSARRSFRSFPFRCRCWPR